MDSTAPGGNDVEQVPKFRVKPGRDVVADLQAYLNSLTGPVDVCHKATVTTSARLLRILSQTEAECTQVHNTTPATPGTSITAPHMGVALATLNFARVRLCRLAAAYVRQLQAGQQGCYEALQAQCQNKADVQAALDKQLSHLEQQFQALVQQKSQQAQMMQALATHKDALLRQLDRDRRHLETKYNKLKGGGSLFSSLSRLLDPSQRLKSERAAVRATMEAVNKEEQEVLRAFSKDYKQAADELRSLVAQSAECEAKHEEVLAAQQALLARADMLRAMGELGAAMAQHLAELEHRMETAAADASMQAMAALPRLSKRQKELEAEMERCHQELTRGQPSDGMLTYKRAAVTRAFLLLTMVRLRRAEQVYHALSDARRSGDGDAQISAWDWDQAAAAEEPQLREIACLCQEWGMRVDPTVTQPDWMWLPSSLSGEDAYAAERPSRTSSHAGERGSTASRQGSAASLQSPATPGSGSDGPPSRGYMHLGPRSPVSSPPKLVLQIPARTSAAAAAAAAASTQRADSLPAQLPAPGLGSGPLSGPTPRAISAVQQPYCPRVDERSSNSSTKLPVAAGVDAAGPTNPFAPQLSATNPFAVQPQLVPASLPHQHAGQGSPEECVEDGREGSFSMCVAPPGMPCAIRAKIAAWERKSSSGRLPARPKMVEKAALPQHASLPHPGSEPQGVEPAAAPPAIQPQLTLGVDAHPDEADNRAQLLVGKASLPSVSSVSSAGSAGSFSFWDPFMSTAASKLRPAHLVETSSLNSHGSAGCSSAENSPTFRQGAVYSHSELPGPSPLGHSMDQQGKQPLSACILNEAFEVGVF